MNKNESYRIAVILPAFNEEKTISKVITDFHNQLPTAFIWVIDNNSSDLTYKIAVDTIQNLKIAGGILTESRQGKGNAIRKAFKVVDADFFVMCDSDLTYPAEYVHELLAPLIGGYADMSIGNRMSGSIYKLQNKRPLHFFGNKFVTSLVNFLFRSALSDVLSGYRGFTREFVKNYPIFTPGFQLETDMTIHALHNGFQILEKDITYLQRPKGSFSKLNTLYDGIAVIQLIFNILRHYRPLFFFGFTSLIFLILGTIAGIPVLNDWINYNFIFRVPLAILATGLVIVSVIFLAIGILLDSIIFHNKKFFNQLLGK
jgi:glycosyltransferase involved in cell wall biosynthesis